MPGKSCRAGNHPPMVLIRARLSRGLAPAVPPGIRTRARIGAKGRSAVPGPESEPSTATRNSSARAVTAVLITASKVTPARILLMAVLSIQLGKMLLHSGPGYAVHCLLGAGGTGSLGNRASMSDGPGPSMPIQSGLQYEPFNGRRGGHAGDLQFAVLAGAFNRRVEPVRVGDVIMFDPERLLAGRSRSGDPGTGRRHRGACRAPKPPVRN